MTTIEAASRNIRVSPELMAEWTQWRTLDGDLVTCSWGEPDADGWYEPTFTRHYDDRIGDLDAAWAEVEAALPNGWSLDGLTATMFGWVASAARDGDELAFDGYVPSANYHDPAAALRDLAAKLKERA